MKNRILTPFLCACLLLWGISVSHAQTGDDWTFQTVPADGTITGSPGSVIGWGYVMTNLSASRWLWPFFPGLSRPLEHATGVATDFGVRLFAVAPGETVSVPFDADLMSGLSGLRWNLSAPDGFVNSGTFTVSGEWYDKDPFTDDEAIPTGDAGTREASYRAIVAGNPPPAPEPGTLALMGVGCYLFCAKGFIRWRTLGVRHRRINR